MSKDNHTHIEDALQAMENCLYEPPCDATDAELQEYDHYYYGSLWETGDE